MMNSKYIIVLVGLSIALIFLFFSKNFARQQVSDSGQNGTNLPIVIKPFLQPQILFASNRTGDEDIYLMNMDGTEMVNLTNHPAKEWNHQWSPDGRIISFLSDRDGNDEIYRLARNGSGRLTANNWSSPLPSMSILSRNKPAVASTSSTPMGQGLRA